MYTLHDQLFSKQIRNKVKDMPLRKKKAKEERCSQKNERATPWQNGAAYKKVSQSEVKTPKKKLT